MPKIEVKGTVILPFLKSSMISSSELDAYASSMVPAQPIESEPAPKKYLFVIQDLNNLDVPFDGFIWDPDDERHFQAFNVPLDVFTQESTEVSEIFKTIFDQYPEEFPKVSFDSEPSMISASHEDNANLRVYVDGAWYTDGSDNTLVPVEVIGGPDEEARNAMPSKTATGDPSSPGVGEAVSTHNGNPVDPYAGALPDPSTIAKTMNTNVNDPWSSIRPPEGMTYLGSSAYSGGQRFVRASRSIKSYNLMTPQQYTLLETAVSYVVKNFESIIGAPIDEIWDWSEKLFTYVSASGEIDEDYNDEIYQKLYDAASQKFKAAFAGGSKVGDIWDFFTDAVSERIVDYFMKKLDLHDPFVQEDSAPVEVPVESSAVVVPQGSNRLRYYQTELSPIQIEILEKAEKLGEVFNSRRVASSVLVSSAMSATKSVLDMIVLDIQKNKTYSGVISVDLVMEEGTTPVLSIDIKGEGRHDFQLVGEKPGEQDSVYYFFQETSLAGSSFKVWFSNDTASVISSDFSNGDLKKRIFDARKADTEYRQKYQSIRAKGKSLVASAVVVFDNGGESFDRYTIIDTASGQMWGASDNPFSPQGFGQYTGNIGPSPMKSKGVAPDEFVEIVKKDGSFGKEVSVDTLPEPVQRYIKQISSSFKGTTMVKLLTSSLSPESLEELSAKVDSLQKEYQDALSNQSPTASAIQEQIQYITDFLVNGSLGPTETQGSKAAYVWLLKYSGELSVTSDAPLMDYNKGAEVKDITPGQDMAASPEKPGTDVIPDTSAQVDPSLAPGQTDIRPDENNPTGAPAVVEPELDENGNPIEPVNKEPVVPEDEYALQEYNFPSVEASFKPVAGNSISGDFVNSTIFSAYRNNPVLAIQASLEDKNFVLRIYSFCGTDQPQVFKFDSSAVAVIPKDILKAAFSLDDKVSSLSFVFSGDKKDQFIENCKSYVQKVSLLSDIPLFKDTCLLDRSTSSAYVFKSLNSSLFMIESKYIYSHKKKAESGSLFVRIGNRARFVNANGNYFVTSKITTPYVYVAYDRSDYFEKIGSSKADISPILASARPQSIAFSLMESLFNSLINLTEKLNSAVANQDKAIALYSKAADAFSQASQKLGKLYAVHSAAKPYVRQYYKTKVTLNSELQTLQRELDQTKKQLAQSYTEVSGLKQDRVKLQNMYSDLKVRVDSQVRSSGATLRKSADNVSKLTRINI